MMWSPGEMGPARPKVINVHLSSNNVHWVLPFWRPRVAQKIIWGEVHTSLWSPRIREWSLLAHCAFQAQMYLTLLSMGLRVVSLALGCFWVVCPSLRKRSKSEEAHSSGWATEIMEHLDRSVPSWAQEETPLSMLQNV